MQPRAWNSSRRRRAISSSADSGHSTPSWPSSDGRALPEAEAPIRPAAANAPPGTTAAAAGDSVNGELGQVPGADGALRDDVVGDEGSQRLVGVEPREELPLSSAT